MMAQYPPLRRDNVTHTYRNAAAFNQHSAQMRQAGWQIGPHTEQNGKATVLWYRDVPPTVPPNAFKPPAPRGGLHPLAIVSIVLASLLGLAIIGGVASGTVRTATATPGNATAPPPGASATSPPKTVSPFPIAAQNATPIPVTLTAAATGPKATPSALPSPNMASIHAAASQTAVPATAGLPTTGIAMPTPVSVAAGMTTQTRWTVTNTSAQLVNVRDNPSVNGAVMRTLAPNEEIESGDKLIPGFDGGGTSWVGVRWGDDYTGYVRSDFVSAPKSAKVSLATPNLAATATAATPDGALQGRLADLDNIVFDIACNKYHKDASKPESWCPYAQTTGIRAHGTAGDEAYLTTTLGKTQAPLARDACQTLWNWATNFDPATKQVSVLSSDGQVLANGVIGSKPCS